MGAGPSWNRGGHGPRRVERIADDLVGYELAHPTALDDAGSLASGRAGVALFHLYRYSAIGNTQARVEATEMLNAAIEGAAALPRGHGLAGGLAGIGFAIAHAAGSLGGDPDEHLTGVDTTLLRAVEASPWQESCDLLEGLIGVGVRLGAAALASRRPTRDGRGHPLGRAGRAPGRGHHLVDAARTAA